MARRAPALAMLLGTAMLGAALMAWGLRISRPAAPPPVPAHSVAVLPFAASGPEARQTDLADGVCSELIDGLARVPQLHVAARISSFQFRGRPVPAGDIARRLNVGALLEGSVRETAGRLHIDAQLIDPATGFAIWSHDYDGALADLFALQAALVQDVAASLGATVPPARAADFAEGGTRNAAAFDAYLRGVKLRSESQNPAADDAALAEFARAVALDPHFAAARANHAREMAFTAGRQAHADPASIARDLQAANVEAGQALSLAPRLGVAHLARFDVMERDLDFPGALHELQLARADAPGDIQVLTEYVFFEILVGHPEIGLAAAQRGVSLDPLSAASYIALAWAQRALHDDAGALASVQRAKFLGADIDPLMVEASIALEHGNGAAARQDCIHFRHWQDYVCLAIANHLLGQNADAERNLDALRATLGDTGAYQYVEIYAQWHRLAEALAWLQTAFRLHDAGLMELRSDPLLEPIRGAPAYAETIASLHFPP